MSIRVLVADNVSPKGVALLEETEGFDVTFKTGMTPPELAEVIGDYDALIVRSATKVTPDILEHAKKLRAIGRAGTGVDNIDLPAASNAGVVVMNTPGGNSVAAAEHTIALMTALARNVSQANADLRAGQWERKKYVGIEIEGKTLGVIGLGRIGREVARRGRGLRMEVLGYDPFVSGDGMDSLGIDVVTLDELLAKSDFVTIHVPKTDDTKNLINAEAIAKMKKGARVINCARGGLLDEGAVFDALESGQLSGCGLDVFDAEPPTDRRLVEHPAVVATPHLGASTVEAQVRVGVEIAQKIRDYLQSGVILDAVNFPSMDRETHAAMSPVMELGERLGSLLGQICSGGMKRLEVRSYGTFGEYPIKPVAMAASKGLLQPVVHGAVSYVNSIALAQSRGVTIEEGRSNENTDYSGLLRLTLTTDESTTTVAGTVLTGNYPRLVEVDGTPIESSLDGHLLFIRNRDVPGVIGGIGSILGDTGVNIAGLQLGRVTGDEAAISIIAVDSPVPADALSRIEQLPEVLSVTTVSIP
ncbi:hypothetical protein ABI59_21460 [Acidobacteria bacterium Mor1]|nr:hypothetical protein ABI59_21460 [Acidobacteria bacterium Mor1]